MKKSRSTTPGLFTNQKTLKKAILGAGNWTFSKGWMAYRDIGFILVFHWYRIRSLNC